jgi:hypothetical protein
MNKISTPFRESKFLSYFLNRYTITLHFTKRHQRNLFFKWSRAKTHFVTSSTFSAFFGTILEPSDFDHIPRKVSKTVFRERRFFARID